MVVLEKILHISQLLEKIINTNVRVPSPETLILHDWDVSETSIFDAHQRFKDLVLLI